jgi:hypothetical protein
VREGYRPTWNGNDNRFGGLGVIGGAPEVILSEPRSTPLSS